MHITTDDILRMTASNSLIYDDGTVVDMVAKRNAVRDEMLRRGVLKQTGSHHFMISENVRKSGGIDLGGKINKVDQEFIHKKSHRDTFEKSEETEALVCDTYSRPRFLLEMPETIFAATDKFAHSMFKDIQNCMNDFYSGKINTDEIEAYFDECCEAMKEYRVRCWQTTGDNLEHNKQIVSEMYAVFAKANARAARKANTQEGKAYNTQYGGRDDDCVYYNADYYYKCESTKEVIKGITAKTAEKWGLPDIDTDEVEEKSVYKFDGKFDFNSGWNFVGRYLVGRGGIENDMLKPPKNFRFFFKEGDSWDDSFVEMELDHKKYYAKVPFTTESPGGSLNGQIYNLAELFKNDEFVRTNKDYMAFLESITVFTRWYSFQQEFA